MEKLLLHICCAPCATAVYEKLKTRFNVAGYFYNPNIWPLFEYDKRLKNLKKLAGIMKIRLAVSKNNIEDWEKVILGLEKEEEGGKRCEVCIRMRLEKTAIFALKNGFEIFATTLSISPFKDTIKINKIGLDLERKYGVKFLDEDFSKAFKKSIILSKKFNLYRQKYCGCVFSNKK